MDSANSRQRHAAAGQSHVAGAATAFSAKDSDMMRRSGARLLPGWWIVPGIALSLTVYGLLLYWLL